jgi:hypothetical protein
MKNKPIENPHFAGCGVCGKIPPQIWPKGRQIIVYGLIALIIDGKHWRDVNAGR